MKEKPTYAELEQICSELSAKNEALEKSLREKDSRYLALFDQSLEAFYVHDLEGRLLDASHTALRILGYSREDLSFLNFFSLLHEDHRSLAGQCMKELHETGVQREPAEFMLKRKDGQYVWMETNACLIYQENRPVAVQGLARDVTERKLVEDILRESEERYRTIFESSGTAKIIADDTSTILLANSGFERLSGFSRSELEKTRSWTDFILDEDLERMESFNSMRFENPDSAPKQYEFRFKDRQGQVRDIFLNVDVIPGKKQIVASCMDITDRKRMEDALRAGEEKYRNILESIEEAFFETDLHGRFTFFNEYACSLLGYSRQEMAGMEIRQYSSPSMARKAYDIFHGIYQTGKPERITEYEVIRKDMDTRVLDMSVSLIRNASGEPVGFRGIARDVTQQWKAEQALRESENRYRLLAENIHDVIWTMDLDLHYTYVSPSCIEMAGFAPEEFLVMPFEKWLDPNSLVLARYVFREEMENAKKGRADDPSKPRTLELKIRRKDGSPAWIEVRISFIRDEKGYPVEMLGIARDITQRKKDEDNLHQSEERFRGLAQLLPQTVYETDETGMLTFANHAAVEQFGYSRREFRKRMEIYQLIAPQDRDLIKKAFLKILKGYKGGLHECTALKKDGNSFSALIHSSAIIRNGVPVGMRGFLTDISEQKNLEMQLMRAQKMEAIGTLAGGIAHDFNNLLMGIQGNASLVLLGMEPCGQGYERLKNIEQYVRSGAELTRQLLGFARGGKYEVRPTDMKKFLEKSSDMFARTKKEIRVRRAISEELWVVEVDMGQMEQVFLNLYVNAWQAMPGGGDLYIQAENVRLSRRFTSPYSLQPGNYVKISITDTGMGMDKSTMERIFEPFFTTKEMGRGTGLGLASVYGIVKNHSGIISVESAKGAGSTFMIYLPATSKEAQELLETPAPKVRHGNETILLVDDEEMILDVGSEILKSIGYHVLTAGSGENALKIYFENSDRVKLVILDMIMPDMGGEETFEAIKKINPLAKVLLSSGYSLDGKAGDIMKKGCQGFIQKPFDITMLSEKIRMIFEDKE